MDRKVKWSRSIVSSQNAFHEALYTCSRGATNLALTFLASHVNKVTNTYGFIASQNGTSLALRPETIPAPWALLRIPSNLRKGAFPSALTTQH